MIHLVVREPLAYQRTLCRALSDSFKGSFVAWFGQEDPNESESIKGFVHQFLPAAGYSSLWNALRNDSEAMVILGGWSSAMAYRTLLITALLRVPVFIWTDHPHPSQRNWALDISRKAYLRSLGRRVAGFLACGSPTVRHLGNLGIPADKILNFPYWVELPAQWSEPKRCDEVPGAGPLRLMAIGRQVPLKGFDIAVQAIALANQKAGRMIARLDLIGDGPERRNLEALATSCESEGAIAFSGWLPNQDVWSRLREADALVVPSKFEPYGVVVLEALANGRPVLASDQVVAALDRDDKTGAILFHQVGDVGRLAGQIQTLANDKDLLRKYSAAARAIAEEWKPERAAAILNSTPLRMGRFSQRGDQRVPSYDSLSAPQAKASDRT